MSADMDAAARPSWPGLHLFLILWCVSLWSPAGAGAQSIFTAERADRPPLGDIGRRLFTTPDAPASAGTSVQGGGTDTPGQADPATAPPKGATWWQAEKRACEGCPRRRVGAALWQTTLINGVYELGNLIRGQETAKITPKTWWHNMEQGWVWDLDDFVVNQFGHPYQGSNYFNTGRANGLSFYESAAVTAFGSATWEYYGETNHPSLNDFINTTLGGIALGEMFHRTAWLIRDTGASGKGRLWREIGATVIDPVTGVNRFISDDSSRVTGKPADMIPSDLHARVSAGGLWLGSQDGDFESGARFFLEIDTLYGDLEQGRSRTPYEAFGVSLRLGGGAALSEATVRGRLFGQPLKDGTLQFDVFQSYDYRRNNAYSTGAQSFEGALGFAPQLTQTISMRVMGWGGLTVLGAIDSLPLGLEAPPVEEVDPEAPQGVSEGPRFYDYGPGSNFGATVSFSHNNRRFAMFVYEGRHLYSLDGVRANHLLQSGRLDLVVPIYGPIGFGFTGEYFDRRTFYQDEARTSQRYHYPQVRTYFTWSL
jgi:hypothetical protein